MYAVSFFIIFLVPLVASLPLISATSCPVCQTHFPVLLGTFLCCLEISGSLFPLISLKLFIPQMFILLGTGHNSQQDRQSSPA